MLVDQTVTTKQIFANSVPFMAIYILMLIKIIATLIKFQKCSKKDRRNSGLSDDINSDDIRHTGSIINYYVIVLVCIVLVQSYLEKKSVRNDG